MIRVISLFCGIGGADLGVYAAARYLGIDVEVVAAYDSWAKAVDVYNANLPHPVAQVADIKKLTRADLPPHELVIGGPPCQPYSLAGKRAGADDPRDCLQDFVRLSSGSAWVMENVIPRLLNAPFSVKLNAFDYGDATTRKRWFYSDHFLDVLPASTRRRLSDIRDSRTPKIRNHDASKLIGDEDPLPSLLAHSWHGYDKRSGWLIAPGRCVTLLEMQRAHGLADEWEWLGTKGDPDRGQMIANMWPVGMATAVMRAMFVAMGAVERAA